MLDDKLVIKNQTRQDLKPIIDLKIDEDITKKDLLTRYLLSTLRPKNPSYPLTISYDNKTIDENQLVDNLLECFDEKIKDSYESFVNAYFSYTLLHFNHENIKGFRKVFLYQAIEKENMLCPSDSVIYNVSDDIKGAINNFKNGFISKDELEASFMATCYVKTLGFYFKDNEQFRNFKDALMQIATPKLADMSQESKDLLGQFMNLEIDDIEFLSILNKDEDMSNPNSFQRLLYVTIMFFASNKKYDTNGILAYDLEELISPKSIMFFNIEGLEKAKVDDIKNRLININNYVKKPNLISNKRLNTLSTIEKAQNRVKNMVQNLDKNKEKLERIKEKYRLGKAYPTSRQIENRILAVIKKAKNVYNSKNIYKTERNTYKKPSRRNPMDYNISSKTYETKYKPNIHIYLDTSGSIDEDNYESAIRSIIKIAKKIDTDIYFNSFSHTLSQTSLVKVKNKTPASIYKQIKSIPKVSGGTEYNNIYNYINASNKRKNEVSIIITDFEWEPDVYTPNHPYNLYYIPCSNIDFDYLVRHTQKFIKGMKTIEPQIRKHILF